MRLFWLSTRLSACKPLTAILDLPVLVKVWVVTSIPPLAVIMALLPWLSICLAVICPLAVTGSSTGTDVSGVGLVLLLLLATCWLPVAAVLGALAKLGVVAVG